MLSRASPTGRESNWRPPGPLFARISSDPRNVRQIQNIVAQVNARIGAYLALKTVVSVIQGLVSWAILELVGVEFAAFWDVLIGMLNYVPYLGSVLGVLFPVAFATMQSADFGVALAAWSALWGFPGAFLAVPITACMVLVFAEFPETCPIAILLSRNGEI